MQAPAAHLPPSRIWLAYPAMLLVTGSTFLCALSQTPPAQQPQPALARAANAAFAEGMQASLARMLAELAAAGVFERPPQVFQHGDAIPRKAQHCSARPLHGGLLCLNAPNYHLHTSISRQAPLPR